MKNKTGITIDFENALIEMTKSFAKQAAIFGSDAYQMLQKAKADYPSYMVSTREIKKSNSKETYRGLTYKKMEDYILSHPDSEKNLAEYSEMRQIAEMHTVQYPHIKQWFLQKYPEVKNFAFSNLDKKISPLDIATSFDSHHSTEIKVA